MALNPTDPSPSWPGEGRPPVRRRGPGLTVVIATRCDPAHKVTRANDFIDLSAPLRNFPTLSPPRAARRAAAAGAPVGSFARAMNRFASHAVSHWNHYGGETGHFPESFVFNGLTLFPFRSEARAPRRALVWKHEPPWPKISKNSNRRPAHLSRNCRSFIDRLALRPGAFAPGGNPAKRRYSAEARIAPSACRPRRNGSPLRRGHESCALAAVRRTLMRSMSTAAEFATLSRRGLGARPAATGKPWFVSGACVGAGAELGHFN